MPERDRDVPWRRHHEKPENSGAPGDAAEILKPTPREKIGTEYEPRQHDTDGALRQGGGAESGEPDPKPSGRWSFSLERSVKGDETEGDAEGQGKIHDGGAGEPEILQRRCQDDGGSQCDAGIEENAAKPPGEENPARSEERRRRPRRGLAGPQEMKEDQSDPIIEDRLVEPGFAPQGGGDPIAANHHLPHRLGVLRLVLAEKRYPSQVQEEQPAAQEQEENEMGERGSGAMGSRRREAHRRQAWRLAERISLGRAAAPDPWRTS